MNESREEAIERSMDRLIHQIGAYNESSNMPYRIEFSYGMTIFNREYHSIDELIERSDQLMYKEKRSKSVQSQ
jgi:GGDEF domain-containing protein